MARHVRLSELLVGVEGLALLRHLYDGTDEAVDHRLEEVRRVLDGDAFETGEAIREATPREGYRAWSELYDEPGNPIIELEETVVWSLFDSHTPGRALDAGCGTGRHSRRLAELGYEVVGVDLTPEMLERAVANVPEARFLHGDLLDLPVEDRGFDLVVCGLALSHVAELGTGVGELARVLRPGGHLVISVLHPFQAYLGWQAPFTGVDGTRGFVREHMHNHAAYLAAFRAHGLELCDCLEATLTADHVRAKRRAFSHVPDAAVEAYAGLPGVLVWDVSRRPR